MKPKQAEMDAVAEDIYRRLVEGDSRASDQELPTLFILCGDHGMNEVNSDFAQAQPFCTEDTYRY
jgi:hypothetical protein